MDAFDRLVPVGVERRARREPDLDLGGIATRGPGARRDPLDGVGDHLGQEAGAGDHAVKELAAEMQGLGPFGTERDRDPLAHRLAMPADTLWPTVIRALAGRDQIPHAGDVVRHPRATRRRQADVVDSAVAAADIQKGSALGHGVDRGHESRHDLGLAGQGIGRMNTDLSVCRGLRNQRRADIGVAADKAGVVGADQFDPGPVDDPDQLGKFVEVPPVGKRRPAYHRHPKSNLHYLPFRTTA